MTDQKTKQTVLQLLANELFQAQRDIPENADWEQVLEECRKQTVTVHGWKQASKAAGLPEEIAEKWKPAAVATAVSNFRVAWEHVQLGKWMEEAGIPYVILKGCASAAYYPHPEDRLMGDVDFLVRPEDLEKAGQVLESKGFKKFGELHIHHIAYIRENLEVEMHFAVGGIPSSAPGERVRNAFADILEQSKEIQLEGGRVRVPSDFHHGLSLLLHTNQHLQGDGIGLRHLCDWAVFAGKFSDREFRGLFEKPLKSLGLWRFACILTQTSVRWLGCPEKGWMGKAETQLTDGLINEVFGSGNFGRKQTERSFESMLISDRGNRVVTDEPMIERITGALNARVLKHWPAAKKIPLLFPIGWIFFGARYQLRALKGKRIFLHPRQLIRHAEERKRRYREMGLFETKDE